MSNARGRWKKLALRATVTLAVMIVPLAAWAYKEGWQTGRLVTSGSGCIQQASFVHHTDDHALMTITGRAFLTGLARDARTGNCNSVGRNKQMRGTQRLMLYWADKNSDPNYDYGLCQLIDKTHNWTTSAIEIAKEYSTPPCGEGWYAMVYCLTDVDTYMQTDNGVKLGWFNAVNARAHCNISPAWHPAIHGRGGEVGPPVTF
jgi:hypothetical protein